MFGTKPAFLADYRSLEALDMRYISIFSENLKANLIFGWLEDKWFYPLLLNICSQTFNSAN